MACVDAIVFPMPKLCVVTFNEDFYLASCYNLSSFNANQIDHITQSMADGNKYAQQTKRIMKPCLYIATLKLLR